MIVTICAHYYATRSDHGTTVRMYKVPDRYDDEASVLKLFERIATDFAKSTEDDYAKEQIECGFDWGVFFDCIDNSFMYRYGVMEIAQDMGMVIEVEHDVAII